MKTCGGAEVKLHPVVTSAIIQMNGHFLLLTAQDWWILVPSQSLSGTEPRTLSRPARSVVAEPTELSWPLQGNRSHKQALIFVLTDLTGFGSYESGQYMNGTERGPAQKQAKLISRVVIRRRQFTPRPAFKIRTTIK
jgi:hypothetical protein